MAQKVKISVKSIGYRIVVATFFSYVGQIFATIFLEMSNAASRQSPVSLRGLQDLQHRPRRGIGDSFVFWNKNILVKSISYLR